MTSNADNQLQHCLLQGRKGDYDLGENMSRRFLPTNPGVYSDADPAKIDDWIKYPTHRKIETTK